MRIDKFLEIEKKYGLNNIDIKGVECWNYIRFNMWNYEICANQFALGASINTQQRTVTDRMKKAGRILKSAFKKNVAFSATELLIINHPRRIFTGEVYECKYTERFSRIFSSVTLERPNKQSCFYPINTKNVVYTDYIDAKSKLIYLLHKKLKTRHYLKIHEAVKEQFDSALKELQEAFKVKIDFSKNFDKLTEHVIRYHVEDKLYRELIEKIAPKAVLEVVYYSKMCMHINEICKEKRILTIELQHGTMHSEHAAYQMPRDIEIKQLPEYMFLFSDYWKRIINVPIKDENMLAVGFPIFEDTLKRYKNHTVPRDKCTILFISQGTIGKQLSKIAVQIAEKLNQDYRIIYKLHPGEYPAWRNIYPWLVDSGIEVIDTNRSDLYELFSFSDLQIGVYSTAIYEGLGFGLKTLIYEAPHWETMSDLIACGMAKSFSDVEEAIELICDKTISKTTEIELWKLGAEENIVREINRIMH